MQIRFAVTAKLISAFVFAIRIVQFLYYLNPKFQASSHLLWLYSPVCVRPGRKPRRPVFSERGSYHFWHQFHHYEGNKKLKGQKSLTWLWFLGCTYGLITFELCREKTYPQGFQPGPTKTWLYSHRGWLKISILGSRRISLANAVMEGHTAQMLDQPFTISSPC